MTKLTMKKLARWTMGTAAACAVCWALSAAAADAATPDPGAAGTSVWRTVGLGIGAGLAVGLSILGAGHAVGRIGSAAVGAIAEKPSLMGRAILFVALGEGLAILGFAFAMILLSKM